MSNLKIEPYNFQKEGIQFAMAHHYCIIADEMGLGKTLQAIGVAANIDKPFLVVCPASLQENWNKEIQKFTDLTRYDIISYTSFKNSPTKAKHAKLIIADEAHYLKNVDAQRTAAFHEAVDVFTPDRLLLLSGTPIKNRIPEFYSLLMLMASTKYATNGKRLFCDYYQFCNTFANRVKITIPTANGSRTITKYEGVKNIDVLRSYLKDKWIRRKAADVLDLPPVTEIDHCLGFSDDSEWQALMNDFLENRERTSVSQDMSGAKAHSALMKAEHTVEYVQNILDQGQPVIVFSDHVESAKTIQKGIRGSRIAIGETPAAKRARLVSSFQEGNFDCLVCTTGAMSEGHNITRANQIVFNDLPWVTATYEQAFKRIHRIGQTKPCFIHIVQWGKVDSMIADTLKKKAKLIEKACPITKKA